MTLASGGRKNASLYRSPAVGGVDRRNIDSRNSTVVELHRRHLLDRYGSLVAVEDVRPVVEAAAEIFSQ
jgi:hypothetical protein